MTTESVTGFDSIIDQERPLRALRTLLSHGTIPHALLFTGIEGVGKRSAAVAFAMACNCRSPLGTDPCGACSACRRASAIIRAASSSLSCRRALGTLEASTRSSLAVTVSATTLSDAFGSTLSSSPSIDTVHGPSISTS